MKPFTRRLLRFAVLFMPALGFAADGPKAQAPATPEEARAFVEKAEARLLLLDVDANRASWVQSNFITDDTETLAAQANERRTAAVTQLAKDATRFDGMSLPADTARKLKLLKLAIVVAAPSDPAQSQELARIVAGLEGTYGKGKYCKDEKCLDLEEITKIMATSRDAGQLLDVWKGWHTVSVPMRKDFARYVTLANTGAKELGYPDTGALWRSKYDMPPDAFAREVDRLWEQVKPLYLSLHAYVRKRLREQYGEKVVPKEGPIPAHLLGNMWAQEWNNVYPIVAPKNSDRGFDVTAELKAQKYDALKMVRTGEAFFGSLGFAPLPKTFWERSLFTKPCGREVVCHASAWDVDDVEDLRLKMCIDITEEDFNTVHHELGHNFYQRAYDRQPLLFRDSANDGFHEAIGDTIALSITPDYLKKIGLISTVPASDKDIGLLMNMALQKIAFLPFGLMIDKWRWEVFSGQVPEARWNDEWWKLRIQYQGIAPAVARSEADFDPGAKYHVAANVPYVRYFLAEILQFQFHRALARTTGCSSPLHRCSIYGNAEAGKRLASMLEMGQSRPWPDALEKMTGQRQMDATAILDYFAPLKKWLDEQTKGEKIGW